MILESDLHLDVDSRSSDQTRKATSSHEYICIIIAGAGLISKLMKVMKSMKIKTMLMMR